MITKRQWDDIPIDIRYKLIDIFGIPRTGIAIVESDVVKDDGRTEEDLAKGFEIHKMLDYLGDIYPPETTIDELFLKVIAKVQKPETDNTTTSEKEPLKSPIIADNNELKAGVKCDLCDFIGKSKQSLRVHKGHRHK